MLPHVPLFVAPHAPAASAPVAPLAFMTQVRTVPSATERKPYSSNGWRTRESTQRQEDDYAARSLHVDSSQQRASWQSSYNDGIHSRFEQDHWSRKRSVDEFDSTDFPLFDKRERRAYSSHDDKFMQRSGEKRSTQAALSHQGTARHASQHHISMRELIKAPLVATDYQFADARAVPSPKLVKKINSQGTVHCPKSYPLSQTSGKQRGLTAAITKRLRETAARNHLGNVAPGILPSTNQVDEFPAQVQARSAPVLLSLLLDPNTRLDVYERTVRRLLRLLVEETFGIGYRRQHGSNPITSKTVSAPTGVIAGTFQSVLLMREFRSMAPSSPTGTLIVRHHQIGTDTSECRIQWSAPVSGQYVTAPVLLLVDDVLPHEEDSNVAHSILLCLQILLFRGVQESDITIVLMFCSSAFATLLRRRFPQIQVVTLKMVEDKQRHHQLMVTQHRERLRGICKQRKSQPAMTH